MKENKILIIKFGGLGDVVLSLDAMYSIKNNYKKSKLTLLTEKPYDDILEKSGWFDEIVLIKRSLFYFLDIFQIKKKNLMFILFQRSLIYKHLKGHQHT